MLLFCCSKKTIGHQSNPFPCTRRRLGPGVTSNRDDAPIISGWKQQNNSFGAAIVGSPHVGSQIPGIPPSVPPPPPIPPPKHHLYCVTALCCLRSLVCEKGKMSPCTAAYRLISPQQCAVIVLLTQCHLVCCFGIFFCQCMIREVCPSGLCALASSAEAWGVHFDCNRCAPQSGNVRQNGQNLVTSDHPIRCFTAVRRN